MYCHKTLKPSKGKHALSLLVLPTLEARRRRKRGEIVKKVLSSRVLGRGGYIGEGGQPEVDQGPQAPPWRGLGGGRARCPPGPPLAPLWPHLGSSRSFLYTDFSYIFPAFFWHFK